MGHLIPLELIWAGLSMPSPLESLGRAAAGCMEWRDELRTEGATEDTDGR